MKVNNAHIDATAFHEAGHAVAALQQGRYVGYVTVSYEDPGNGLTYFGRPNSTNPFEGVDSMSAVSASWEWQLRWAKEEMKISLAGPLAEAKALGKPLRTPGAILDFQDCIRVANQLNRFSRTYSRRYPISFTPGYQVMNQSRVSTRRWLAHPKIWRMIVTVARHLSERGKLFGPDLCYLVGLAGEEWEQSVIQLR